MLDNTATAITNAEREKINCKSNLAASEIVNNIGVQSTSSNYYYPGAIFRFSSWERPIFVPRKAKTIIDTTNDKGIEFGYKREDNCSFRSKVIIPHIKDIQIIQNRVVIVIFADGSKEKAVLDSADTFSLEQGISICITKKMLSMETNGNGSSAYNKLINHCLKLYENNRKAEEKAKADEQAAKEKKKKAADKARAKRIKKANKNREREIEIQKEAYLRAMREFGGNSAVND